MPSGVCSTDGAAIPQALLELWRATVNWPDPPDACLVNLYRDTAKMGLHQDRDEADLKAPVLSVSLGDTAVFRIAGADGKTSTLKLESGDVCALAGPARYQAASSSKTSSGTQPVPSTTPSRQASPARCTDHTSCPRLTAARIIATLESL